MRLWSIKTEAWDGRFKSVEPMKYQKPCER